jgi:uncharacterized membrane protein YidH (DUF202 family)
MAHGPEGISGMKTIGIALVVLGVLALVYGGISYSKNRTVLEVGSMHVTATEQKHIPVPAVVGVAALIGGVAMMVMGKRGTKAL